MSDIIPIFYDHSSEKSILTFWNPKDCYANGPQSIFSMAEEAKLKEIVFVSKSFATFLEAWKGCKSRNIKLIFGVEIIMCDDAKAQTPESRYNEHKIIVFARNSKGYSDLLKVYSSYHTDPTHKYYRQRFDYNQLAALWTPDLYMSVPFFDGFIARNLLGFNTNILPDLSFCNKNISLFQEVGTEHPHELLISDAISKYVAASNNKVQKTKTIYYKNRKDFRAYTVYRAIQNGGSFADPDIEYFCSDAFCFEVWRNLST